MNFKSDLTEEEFEEMVELAVDEAIERMGSVTAPGLMIFLKKYSVDNDKGRTAAFAMLKEMNVKVHSNEGYGGSGRLNTPNR